MNQIKYLFYFLIFISSQTAFGQGWVWGQAGGGEGNDAWAVATDPSGNVYGAGITLSDASAMTFGSLTAPPSDLFEQTVWVKYSNAGVPLWTGGTEYSQTYLYNICTDAGGNLFVFGEFDGDSVGIGGITLHRGTSNNYFLAKISPTGTTLWAVNGGNPITFGIFLPGYTSAPILSVGGVATDAAGNVYITSSYNGSMTIGSTSYSSAGGYDIFVAKYSSTGTLLWSQSIGGSGNDYGFGITVSSAGNVYVCGAYYSPSITVGSSTIGSTYPSKPQAYIAELSSAGVPLWAQAATSASNGSFGVGLASDNYNNVYMTGGFGDATITFGTTTITRTYPAAVPDLALYLVQFNGGSGTVTWEKTIGSASSGVWGYCIAMAACGQVWVSGNYREAATIDTATLAVVSGPDPIFIAGYNLTGGVVGYSGLGSGGDDQNAIACDGSGNVFLCSDFQGSVTVGTTTLTGFGGGSEYFYMGKYANVIAPPDTTNSVHDTAFCGVGAWMITLRADTGYTNYYWSNGTDADTLNVTDTGTYYVYCVTCGEPVMVDTFHVLSVPSDTTYEHQDTSLCNNVGPLTLYAPGGHPNYLWNTGSTASSISVTASGTYYVLMEAACTLLSDTFHVTFEPSPSLTMRGDTGFCYGNSYTLTVNEPAGITYLWNTGSTNNYVIVDSPGANFYRLTVFETTNGVTCSTSDTVTIYVSPLPVVDLGDDTAICTGVTPLLQSSVSYPSGTVYLWNTGATTPSITALFPGTYSLKVTVGGVVFGGVTIGGCTDSSSIVVSNIFDTLNFPMKDTAICNGNMVRVRASGTPGMTYQWIPTAGIAMSNVLDALINPDTSAMYYLTANISVCPPIVDSFFIDVQPNPWVYIGGNQGVCQHDSLHLHANVKPGWYQNYTFAWTPGTNLDDSTTQTVVFTPGDPTLIKVTVSTSAGCIGTDSAMLIVYPGDFAHSDTQIHVCPLDSAIIVPVSTDPSTTYAWHPGLFLDDSSKANPIVRPITSITYMAVAKSSHGCLDTVYATVSVSAAAVLDVGDSVTLYPGEQYQIPVQTNCTTFEWFPGSGLSSAWISSPVASPTISTKYVVTGITSWGCIATDSINIYVSDASLISVPNAFSPGEGPNTLFKLILKGEASLNYLRIFNRWGNLIYETTNINEGWDGTYKGKPQPQDVYIYQVEAVANGSTFQKSGNVTLLR